MINVMGRRDLYEKYTFHQVMLLEMTSFINKTSTSFRYEIYEIIFKKKKVCLFQVNINLNISEIICNFGFVII